METLQILRNGEIKLTLPRAEIKSDGTIWAYGLPLLNSEAPGAIDNAEAQRICKAKNFTAIPTSMFARLGSNPSGLLVIRESEHRAELERKAAEARRAYEVTHPGAAERRAISDLFARAERRLNASDDSNTMDYHRLTSEARARLAKWRERYPAEAREEDADHLREQAAKERELASGALIYDADGWLDATERQRRHDEHMAKAAEYEAQAAALLASGGE